MQTYTICLQKLSKLLVDSNFAEVAKRKSALPDSAGRAPSGI
jgi:hypothetical protein